MQEQDMIRYSKLTDKRPREIVLLKGAPCAWGRCTFCDYIEDNEVNMERCHALNRQVLAQVTGEFGALEIINSASVFELPQETWALIRQTVQERGISLLYFESHWSYREELQRVRDYFGVPIIFKCGIETFDDYFRNQVLKKGAVFSGPEEVRRHFSSICLMVGIQGQTREMISRDMEILTQYFPHGCVNVYVNNSTPIRRDEELVRWFCQTYGHLAEDPNIDLLLNNTDFEVGTPL